MCVPPLDTHYLSLTQHWKVEVFVSLHLTDGKPGAQRGEELAQSYKVLNVSVGGLSCGWGGFVLFGPGDSKEQNVPYS